MVKTPERAANFIFNFKQKVQWHFFATVLFHMRKGVFVTKQQKDMETYAYIRVSTKEQNIDRQILALKKYNIQKTNIFCDFQSGKDFNRPEYKKLISKLKNGDLLIIKSIDRLGRNYNDILMQWQFITKEIKADILVLDMELLDTRKKDGNLTGTFISDLVLQLLAYVAETERRYIRQRQAEGIAVAKLKGKKLGRKALPLPKNYRDVFIMHMDGKISVRKGAELLRMSPSTFYRKYKIFEKNHQFGTQKR